MIRKIFLTISIWFLLGGILSAYAADPQIIEAQVSEDSVTAYIKGAGSVDSVDATLGREPVDVIRTKTIEAAEIPIRTLILIDNSLSIPSNQRSAIRQQFSELIAARREGETYAIGTISNQVSILQDFTDDYLLLKRTLDDLPHHDQVTYITDALYDYLVQKPFSGTTDCYIRIVLASDGVDNKSLGYTKDELLGLLQQEPVPIHAIGIPNGKKGNNEELENMFSIARATGGIATLLSDLNSGRLAEVLNGERQNLVCSVHLPESTKDGSLQTLTVNLHKGNETRTASFDQLRMPVLEKTETSAPEPEPESEPAPEPAPTPTPQPEPEPEPPSRLPLFFAIGALCVFLVLAVLVWRKKRQDGFQTLSTEDEVNQRLNERLENEATVKLAEEQGNGTMHVWDVDSLRRVTLTDLQDTSRCYQKPISQSLIIGLSQESDICINYDKSVSRKQCEIVREGEQFYILNHSQSNGTAVNGIRIFEKTRLSDGDILKMGRVEMRVEFNR